MDLKRQIRYVYIRFIRLKGEPRELALGMALGIFVGLLPIVPFQTALAVTLAILLKGSKITAAIGTWISNPLNWYFLYYYTYKIGAFVLRMPRQEALFASIMIAIRSEENILTIAEKILEAGMAFAIAFLVGGILLGILFAVPGYFIFLRFFNTIRQWRRTRKDPTP